MPERLIRGSLGVLPLLSLLLVVVLNWPQFLALFGLGAAPPRFSFVLKEPGLPGPTFSRSFSPWRFLKSYPTARNSCEDYAPTRAASRRLEDDRKKPSPT
jgi:hypothetical protein